MAASRSANAKLQINAGSVSGALASAALEWMIIIMLLIDAIFSCLITSLAQFFDLEAPCLLCSRLNHVIDKAKHGFSLEKMCRNHKLQLSSLIFCHLHENLVDVHGVCGSCLVSFISSERQEAGTCALLVGQIMGSKLSLLPLKGHDSLSSEKCVCCDKPRAPSRPVEMLMERSIGISKVSGSAVVRDEGNGFNRGKSCTSYNSSEPFCHVRYAKLQNSSDAESDELIHNEIEIKDPVYTAGHAGEGLKKDVQPDPQTVDLIDTTVSEKHMCQSSECNSFQVLSEIQPDANEMPMQSSLPCILDEDNESNKPKWQHIGTMRSSTTLPEQLISRHPSPEQSSLAEVAFDELNKNTPGDENHDKTYEDAEKQIVVERTSPIQAVEETDTQAPDNLELTEAYKPDIGGKGRQSSGKFSEEFSRKDSGRTDDDVKILLSRMSSARGFELSPYISANTDQFSMGEPSTFPCPRSESGSESSEGSVISEHEGESLVDRLRRQIEHDRKLLNELHMELDEERNACAVAANQALAMISRLQKEKAELRMEALQYLRMMEEQAEYDNQALQESNDFIVEKEREVCDLEEKLAFYRNMLGSRDDVASANFET